VVVLVFWRHVDASVESIRDATDDQQIGGDFSRRCARGIGIAPERRTSGAGNIPSSGCE